MTDAHARIEDAEAQIARLREQVERLIRDKVVPASEQLGAHAREAAAAFTEETEAMKQMVRARPIAAVLIAAAVGFVLGRAVR